MIQSLQGSVNMIFHCVKATSSISLHKNVLTVDETSITVTGPAGNLSVTGVEYDEPRQFAIIHLGESMQVLMKNKLFLFFTQAFL